MAPAPSTRAPFDDADADIIFRSDSIDFRLYKVVLAKASPVFRGMLALPEPAGEPQVVQLTEDARTLEHLLRLCCPVEHPPLADLDDVAAVLEAARKYEMAAVTANLRSVLRRFLPDQPLRVYALAYLFTVRDVAREAAERLLDDPQFHTPDRPPPEFSVLPALAIYAVHTFRERCIEAALRAWDDQEWIVLGTAWSAVKTIPEGDGYTVDPTWSWVWFVCSGRGPCTRAAHDDSSPHVGLDPFTVLRLRQARSWWGEYFQSLKTALSERPSGRCVREYIREPQSFEALRKAASCPTCSPKAHAHLLQFTELFATKIDAAIAQVNFELD